MRSSTLPLSHVTLEELGPLQRERRRPEASATPPDSADHVLNIVLDAGDSNPSHSQTSAHTNDDEGSSLWHQHHRNPKTLFPSIVYRETLAENAAGKSFPRPVRRAITAPRSDQNAVEMSRSGNRMPLEYTDTMSSADFLNSRTRLNRDWGQDSLLLSQLDSEAPEVLAVQRSKLIKLKDRLLGKESTNYTDIREKYRLNREQSRKPPSAHQFIISFLFSVFIAREYRGKLRFALKHRFMFFLTVDLIVDICFCILYLVELQANIGHRDVVADLSPEWLYVPRSPVIFRIAEVLSYHTLWSLLFKVAIADSKREALFNYRTALDLVICVPLAFILPSIHNGQRIFVPYYFRAAVLVSRIRNVLHLRANLSVSRIDLHMERLLILVVSIIALLYVAACSFSFSENRFSDPGDHVTLPDAFYFIVITASTVGYGDLSPKSIQGQFVVVCFVIIAIAVLPSLIGEVVETVHLRSAGGGTFTRGRNPFVVIAGSMTPHIISDTMTTFFHRDRAQQVNVVFLGRTPPTPAIKSMLRQSAYLRAAYLQGSALDAVDLQRVHLKHAAAAFIVADRSAKDMTLEDDQNTLRAWAFDSFAPLTPLYTYHLLPESEAFLEATCNETVCVADLQQTLLGYNCLYKGVGTLLLNLLVQTSPLESYEEPWMAQYGDGAANEIYKTKVPPVLAGKSFQEVSFYLYREYQVICFAVRVFLKGRDAREGHLMLNPAGSYTIGASDELFHIAPGESDVQAIETLTADQFAESLRNSPDVGFSLGSGAMRRPQFSASTTDDLGHAFPTAGCNEFIVGTPKSQIADFKVALCRLLKEPLMHISDMMLTDATTMTNHILIISGNLNVFRLICTLRSAHLTQKEFRSCLLLCPRDPTEEEFTALAQFPSVFILVGDPRNKNTLLRAGVVGAARVLIVNLHRTVDEEDRQPDQDESFADSSAIMVSQMIYQMFRPGQKKLVVVELLTRIHIKFLRPTAKRILKRRNRRRQATPAVESTENPDAGVDHYLYAPVYAAGRVLAASMLDAVLFETFFNSAVLEIFKLMCGLRLPRDVEMDALLGVDPSFLCHVHVPADYVGRTFVQLYAEFALNQGILPLGLLRAPDETLGNKLAFVFTNPLPSLVLKTTDIVYVLTPVTNVD
ncbi:potassium channel, sub T, member 2 [Geranomyces variabilis]|nr:potassium channel, sub T, member 2 [Geranomyces variabilis]